MPPMPKIMRGLPQQRFYPLLLQGAKWGLEVERLQSSYAFRIKAAGVMPAQGAYTLKEILLPRDASPERADEFLLELGDMLSSLQEKKHAKS